MGQVVQPVGDLNVDEQHPQGESRVAEGGGAEGGVVSDCREQVT